MKNKCRLVLIGVLCVVFMVAFIGCGDSDSEEPAATEETLATEESSTDVIELEAGTPGDYGKEITMNEGTDMEESLIVYYVPAGDYTVTNVGEFMTQVSVYGGFERDESTGYDDYTEVGDTPSIDVDQSADISVPDGWFIEIHEPTHITLEKK